MQAMSRRRAYTERDSKVHARNLPIADCKMGQDESDLSCMRSANVHAKILPSFVRLGDG